MMFDPPEKPKRTETLETYHGKVTVELETNPQGGKQSKLDVRYDLIDPVALRKLAHTLHGGFLKYGKDNWRLIESDSHLNHALNHIYLYLEGKDQDEDHLAHSFCRLMMAIAMREEEKRND